jgi:hypothetical protein
MPNKVVYLFTNVSLYALLATSLLIILFPTVYYILKLCG